MDQLSDLSRNFLMSEAERFTANFYNGMPPDDPDDPLQVEEASLGGTLQAYLAYFAIPEQAGQQVLDFLERLPIADDIPTAFIRIKVLLEVHDRLAQIVGEEAHMKTMTSMPGDDADAAVRRENKKNPTTPLDSIVRNSAQNFDDQNNKIDEGEIEKSAFDGSTSDRVDDEIFDSAQDFPNRKDTLDFSRLDPNGSFKQSIKILLQAIYSWVIQAGKTIHQHQVMKKQDIVHIGQRIQAFSRKLPLPGGGRDHAR